MHCGDLSSFQPVRSPVPTQVSVRPAPQGGRQEAPQPLPQPGCLTPSPALSVSQDPWLGPQPVRAKARSQHAFTCTMSRPVPGAST